MEHSVAPTPSRPHTLTPTPAGHPPAGLRHAHRGHDCQRERARPPGVPGGRHERLPQQACAQGQAAGGHPHCHAALSALGLMRQACCPGRVARGGGWATLVCGWVESQVARAGRPVGAWLGGHGGWQPVSQWCVGRGGEPSPAEWCAVRNNVNRRMRNPGRVMPARGGAATPSGCSGLCELGP